MINKKAAVRKHLLSLREGDTFTMSSIAQACKVSTKDVSNVTSPMHKQGILQREMVDGTQYYRADPNALALYASKYPTEYHGKDKLKVVAKTNGSVPKQVAKPRKRRSPVIMEIDSKIAYYNSKIDSLKSIRKEFV